MRGLHAQKKVVVFAPHPDDEILGCGGTMAKKLAEGYNVSIVFLTDGRYALKEVGIKDGPIPSEVKRERKEDAIRATRTLGLGDDNIFFLDVEDKTLTKHERETEQLIVEMLEEISPTEIYFPQEKEYNIDHRITNKIVKNAVKRSKISTTGYQYIIAWSFPFYLLTHVMRDTMFDQLMTNLMRHNLIRIDISRFLHLKINALKEYRSQITFLSHRQRRAAIKPSLLKSHLKNEEKFFVSKFCFTTSGDAKPTTEQA